MACDRASAEMETEEGDEVKEDEEVEFDIVEGADSPLVDDVVPCGSNEAAMLFIVLRGMWTKPSKKRTEKTRKKLREVDENKEEPLVEKKNAEKLKKNWTHQWISWSM